jgi:primosomal protein N' (replication factor Y)
MPTQGAFAAIAVARPLPEPLTYLVPDALRGTVQVGHVVAVPLGGALETGFVVDLPEASDVPEAKLRPIARLVDPIPAFDARQLGFFRWIADYYLCPLGPVIRAAVPSDVGVRSVRGLVATEAGVEAVAVSAVDEAAAVVLREVIRRPALTRRGLAQRLGAELGEGEAGRAADQLVRRGLARWEEREVGGVRARVDTVRLVGAPDAALAAAGRSAKAVAVARALAESGEMDVAALVAAHGDGARAAVKRLVDAGVAERGDRERRDVLDEVPALGPTRPPVLNDDQQTALDALCAPDAAGPWLLHGVTGAGKTEVFLGVAERTLARGRQVCVLVPEIGLTPQLVGRFKARFGNDVAVLHSGLAAGDRLAHWRRIRAGEARVVVGARSALFAPFSDLGLLVVDEEHDDSYKQDDGVCYHARDLAVVLGRRHEAVVVLASATPSMETWWNAESGRYRRLRLPRRATPRPVPSIEIVDLRPLPKTEDGARPMFAPVVIDALRATFDVGGQAIVLYNRRGWATWVACDACGAGYDCPSCGVAMTLHKAAGRLACHHCGFQRAAAPACPVCGAPELREHGRGTERVEDELARRFPDVPMGRMDADTTAERGAHQRLLEAFRAGRTRLLVGTQIVAKGHDFPDVHTVVVVSADHGLRMPDFRAAERTVSLVVQAAGRAGRGDVAGRVLVQTMDPSNEMLGHLSDPDGFYPAELRRRTVFQHPPVTRLAVVHLEGVDRARVSSAAVALGRRLRQIARPHAGVKVLEPAAAPLRRLVGRWRWQVLLRGRDVRAFRAFLVDSRPALLEAQPGVRLAVDVDPRHLT